MLGLANSTIYDKRIPKTMFYEKTELASDLRTAFEKQIKRIHWKHKLASDTINLSAKEGEELEVFWIELKEDKLNEGVLRHMDKSIPYYILFVLEYEGRQQAVIAHKKISEKNVVVEKYFYSAWCSAGELPLTLQGNSIGAVYENLIRQIAGEQLQISHAEESLAESLARREKIEKLKREITRIQAQMRKEKQMNRQLELKKKCRRLQAELEGMG